MQVGDLVRWADMGDIDGIVIQLGDYDYGEVEVWFFNGTNEWCFDYDLEVVCK